MSIQGSYHMSATGGVGTIKPQVAVKTGEGQTEVGVVTEDSCQFSGLAEAGSGKTQEAGPAPRSEATEAVSSGVSQAQAETLLGEIISAAGEAESGSLIEAMNDGPAKGVIMSSDDFATASLGSLASKGISAKGEVPSKEELAGFRYIEHEEAVADYKEHVEPNLNGLQRACIKSYCTFGYLLMNGHLAGKRKSPLGVLHLATKCAAKAVAQGDVPSGSMLYRTNEGTRELKNYMSDPQDYESFTQIYEAGGADAAAEFLDAKLRGTQTERKSFLSTTIDHTFDFKDKPKVATKFYVGEGVKGVYVAADKRLSPIPDEKEFLLAPGTKVTVIGVESEGEHHRFPGSDRPERKTLLLHVFVGDLPEGGLESLRSQLVK